MSSLIKSACLFDSNVVEYRNEENELVGTVTMEGGSFEAVNSRKVKFLFQTIEGAEKFMARSDEHGSTPRPKKALDRAQGVLNLF